MRWLVLALTLGTARAFTPRANPRFMRFTRATTTPLIDRCPACSERNFPGLFSSILSPLVTGTPESGRTVAEEISHGLNESSRTFGSESAGIFTRSATGMGLILIALGHPMGGLDPGLARSAVRLVLGSLGSYRVVCKASAPLPPPSLAHRPFPRPSRSPALLPSRSTPFLLPPALLPPLAPLHPLYSRPPSHLQIPL